MQCLNLSNKEVKAAVDELTQVLGNEDAAYYIISENNGYAIDLAPNGALSELFSALLSHFNGDREQTIKAMAKTFTEGFKMRHRANKPATTATTSRITIADMFGTWSDGEVKHSGKSGEILARVKQHIPEDSIANLLLDLFANTDIEVYSYNESDLLDEEGKRDYMWYSTKQHCIFVNEDMVAATTAAYNAVSIVHEIVHAFTSRAIDNVEAGVGTKLELAVYDRVTKLLEETRALHEGEKYTGALYGLTDEHEFISEFLTNEDFVANVLDAAELRNSYLKIADSIAKVWNTIVDFICDKLNIEHISKNTDTRDLLMQLVSFDVMDLNQDVNRRFEKVLLSKVGELEETIHHAERYHFDNEEELNKRLETIRNKLITGLQSRLKAIDILDISKRTEVIENIKYHIANLLNQTLNDFTVIAAFINDIAKDCRDVGRQVVAAYKGLTDALTDELLVSLNKNYFAFYCRQADDVYNSLNNLSRYRDIIGHEEYDSLMEKLNLCRAVLNDSYDAVKRMQVVNAQRTLADEGVKCGSPTIFEYISERTHETDFDISFITRTLGSGDKINDEAIKSLFSILLDTENEINAVVFQKADELNKLLVAAGRKNQKLLFEVDENGNTTGYIIRDRNYGRFFNDLKKFKEKLLMEFGIDHETMQLPEHTATRVEYNRRLNQWLNEHCERKYTAEFYDLMNSLSPETAYAREMILSKIKTLSNKYRDSSGNIHYESMTDEEWETLQQYELEKKQLASIYDIYGNEKPEGTVERRIADELTELNSKLLTKLIHKYNDKTFLQLIEDKRNTLNKKEFTKWLERNTRVVYTEEFYEELAKLERVDYGEVYADLSKKKRAILNMFRDNRTGEINAKLIPASCKRELDKLDTRMANIRKAKGKHKNGGFNLIARIVPTELFKRDEAAALAADQEVPGSSELFYLLNTFYTLAGTQPKSWYTKIMPKDSKYIQVIPTSNLAELSLDSPFANKEFDSNIDEYYQPKKSLYDNSEEYNKVMNNEALRNLRQAIIDTMQESNDKLNNLEYLNKYRLPLISGSWYKYLKASGYNPFTGTGRWLLDAISRKNDDTGLLKKVKTAPDGTSLALVPQYFTKMLDNPATISANMVGSVILYYRMAENFKLKNAIKAKVENIKTFLSLREYTGSSMTNKLKKMFNIQNDPKAGTDTNIYKFAEKFININVYDHRANSLSFNVNGREISITKALKILTGYGTLRNLGLNFACAFTGFFTAAHNHIMNMLTGRYYTFGNALAAFKDMIFDLFRYGPSAGRITNRSQMMAYMDYFEVGGTLDSLYRNTNRSKLVNTISTHWAFGVYALSDYIIKGLILDCVMYDYKYIDGKFMHHEAYYQKYGRTAETTDRWNKAKSFKAATFMLNGELVARDHSMAAAVKAIKNEIGNTARSLAGSADGQCSALQRALLSANVFGAMCMMHRQYLPIILQLYYLLDRQWDYTTLREVEAILKTPFRVFALTWKDKRGLDLLSTLFNQIVRNKGFESELDRTNIKRLKLELAFTFMLYPLIARALGEDADRDKRNKLLNLFAYIMARTTFESKAPYNLVDIYKTIKTPTPLYSLLDNIGGVISYPLDLIVSNARGEKKSKVDKRIKKGAYRGQKGWERDLWKSTPFKNLIELNDIPSKRRYYDTQIAGN